ncbi:MAG TPA: fibrobacter succinogenes major paralogous domain-containing protein [Spirochaetota bacterium]|nr:fibrobacter succinogenes major paralogous domain-containing protein [Spirochaetota bacterium]
MKKTISLLIMGLLLFSSCGPHDNLNLKPSVTTDVITNITATTATCGGNVNADGDAAVTARGVCWSTSDYPTVEDSKTTDGWGVGSFTSNLDNLLPNTTYYVRAYATNYAGTVYAGTKTFTTLSGPHIPSVAIRWLTNITSTSASCSCNVSSEGGTSTTGRGVCWDIIENPTIEDSKTTDGLGSGDYISDISGLSPYTTYYVRAYATNSEGTAYGQQIVFTTQGEYTDSRDGRKYKYTRIGDQVWMAENLAYLPILENISSYSLPAYYVYGYTGTNIDEAKSTANYITYGVLYNWPAAMNGATSSDTNPSGVQGACPTGWHLPSSAEWEELLNYLCNNDYSWHKFLEFAIAKSMAKENGWESSTGEGAPGNTDYPEYRNKSGFSALPGGCFHVAFGLEEIFFSIGYVGFWWSSSESTSMHALPLYIAYQYYDVGSRNLYDKDYGFSIRCIKD